MNKSQKDFLDAVDVVCINCLKNSEENCEKCPVRYTCDRLMDIKKDEYFTNICSITQIEYKTTKAFEEKLSSFIKECLAKRKEILDAGKDTSNYCNPLTRDVVIADILCGDDVNDYGVYMSPWGVTDKYDSDKMFECKVRTDADGNTILDAE